MKRTIIALIALLALASGIFFVGCETESASQNNLEVTPASAVILIDDSITLTASGGYDYDWSLEHPEWGTLSTTKGNRTVYTSAYDPDPDTWQEHQVITVTSYLNKQADTNSFSAYAQTAEAIITHQTAQVVVQISPPSAAVDEYGSVTFTASGANRYSWSLRQPVYGQLTATTGPTTTYTSTYGPGEEVLQILTCTTDRGTASAHIVHNPEGISVLPSTASLTLGQSVTFTSTGSSSVNWSYSGAGSPYVTDSVSGNTLTLTMSGNFDSDLNPEVVTVTASSGEDSDQASVTLYGTL